MVRIYFRKVPLLQRSLFLFLVTLMWCTVSAAEQGGHWHDHLTISGTPATSVTVGQSYSFTPTASDSQGRALVFAIANMPVWASFNTSNGQLSGTSTAGSVGTYSNIVIAVSDGLKTATLPAFAVQVLASTPPPPAPAPLTIS